MVVEVVVRATAQRGPELSIHNKTCSYSNALLQLLGFESEVTHTLCPWGFTARNRNRRVRRHMRIKVSALLIMKLGWNPQLGLLSPNFHLEIPMARRWPCRMSCLQGSPVRVKSNLTPSYLEVQVVPALTLPHR